MKQLSSQRTFVVVLALSLASANVAFAQATETGQKSALSDTATANTLIKEAWRLYEEKQYEPACKNAEEALKLFSETLGPETKEAADALEICGAIYISQGKYADALKANETALKVRQSIFGNEHLEVASSYFRIGVTLSFLGDPVRALEQGKKALEIRERLLGQTNPDVAFSCHELGAAYFNLGDLEQGIAYNQKALKIRLALYGEDNVDVAASYLNTGVCYNFLGQYDKALQLMEKALKIRYKLLSEEHPDNGAYLNNIGLCYHYKGDDDKAIEYYNKALNIRLKFLGKDHPALRYSYGNLGVCYNSKYENEQAIFYTKAALDITTKTYGEESPEAVSSYLNLGKIYLDAGMPENALEYGRKAVDLGTKLLEENHYLVGLSKGNLGNILMKVGRSKEGIRLNEEANNIMLGLFDESHPDVVRGFGSLSEEYARTGQYAKADSLVNAMQAHLGLRSPIDFKDVKSMPLLIETLYRRANIQMNWYRHDQQLEHLLDARKNYHLSLSALSSQSRVVSPASKSSQSTDAAEICSGAIATNQLLHSVTDSLHYWQESFDYAERSKAYLLYESMKNVDALHISGIPDSLLEQEYQLRVSIAYNDKNKEEYLANGFSDTDSTVLAISSKLFDLNRKHETLIKLFEARYPRYYQAKYGLATASVSEVQQSLLPEQTMLEYAVGDSSVFLFVAQKNHFEVLEIKKDFPLEHWVDSLTRLGIYGYYTLPQSNKRPAIEVQTIENYTSAALQLYEKLIAPVKNKLTAELVIIPDGVLGYVPFEALLSKAPGRKGVFSSYPFLVRDYRISYCYSATLLREMRNKTHRSTPSKSVLALAPFFRGDVQKLNAHIDSTDLLALRADALAALKASGEEAGLIARLWGGTPLYGTSASLDTFRDLAGQYRLLHLSTHGKADDRVGDYAFLALGASGGKQDFEKLYARDLYNLDLNADMVVLSACETGLGKLRRGEGIVSLARAFAYAGSKSLITSLWQVDDERTRDLLVDFHKRMKNGNAKDAALQQAKINFLARNRKSGGALLHPYFWAGFIAIGDMRPVR